MERYIPSEAIELSIVGSPQHRPCVSLIANCRAIINYTSRENETVIEKANGGIDIYSMGDDRTDGVLTVYSASRADAEIIEEIRRRKIPCYIYPRIEGSAKLNMPLIRGIGTDPVDNVTVDMDLDLGGATLLYMIEGDSTTGFYLRKVEEQAFPYLRGVVTGNGEVAEFPTGRGYASFNEVLNHIPDSALSNIHDSPWASNEWELTAGTYDVDGGYKPSPWRDGSSLWLKGVAGCWESGNMNLGFINGHSHLSFLYRLEGTLDVSINYGGGVLDMFQVTSGSGYYTKKLTRQGTFPTATVRFAISSGNWAEIDAPQFINFLGKHYVQYRAAVLGDGDYVQGAKGVISDWSLFVDCDIGSDMCPSGTAANRDGVVYVAGLCQPAWENKETTYKNTLAFAEGYDGSSIELRFGADNIGESVMLFINGATSFFVSVAGHVLGDTYAWMLYSGYENGTAKAWVHVIRLRNGAEYRTHGTGITSFIKRVYLGCRSSAGYNFDGIIGGVTAGSCRWDEAPHVVERLADYANLDYMRRLAGRKFRLLNGLSPRAVDRQFWEGPISIQEIEAI